MAEPASTPFRRRFVISTNILLQCLAVLALMVMINWLVARHYTRFDWTKSGYYKISDKTKQVLTTLKEPLKIIVYFRPTSESAMDDQIFDDVRNLLREFKFFGRQKVSVEYVDPDREPVRAGKIVDEFKIYEHDPSMVIFADGPRHKYVSREEMVDLVPGNYGEPLHIKDFKAEGAFLSAIQSVTEGEPPTVYFLTGHGEHDPESFDAHTGYSTINTYIKRDNLIVQKWNLQDEQSFPTNGGAVVIAGPTKRFAAAELTALDLYLKNHGRVFVMLDPKTDSGLEDTLKKWGVQIDNDLAMRKAGTMMGSELIDVNALATKYAPHPITARLNDVNTEFPYARSVRRIPPAAPGDQSRVTELAFTGPAFWGSVTPDADPVVYNQLTDFAGPLPLAVAVESGQPRDVNVDLGVTRLVVVGTSGFIDNSSLTPGNLDFFMSSLNWLLKREQLLAVGPKVPEEFRLDMTDSQVRAVYGLAIIGMPLAVAILGVIVWLRRRK
jgi:ABC-type uncharacterized transport system involved in gliding motility auxiliary subunit